jgi:hypothetical protein
MSAQRIRRLVFAISLLLAVSPPGIASAQPTSGGPVDPAIIG